MILRIPSLVERREAEYVEVQAAGGVCFYSHHVTPDPGNLAHEVDRRVAGHVAVAQLRGECCLDDGLAACGVVPVLIFETLF